MKRIVWYDQLSYQRLWADGADICTYHVFCSAFDSLTRGQAFERIYVDVPAMLSWLRDHGHSNNNKGRAAYAETLQAISPDIDYIPKQSFAAANFAALLGPSLPLSRMTLPPGNDPMRNP